MYQLEAVLFPLLRKKGNLAQLHSALSHFLSCVCYDFQLIPAVSQYMFPKSLHTVGFFLGAGCSHDFTIFIFFLP